MQNRPDLGVHPPAAGTQAAKTAVLPAEKRRQARTLKNILLSVAKSGSLCFCRVYLTPRLQAFPPVQIISISNRSAYFRLHVGNPSIVILRHKGLCNAPAEHSIGNRADLAQFCRIVVDLGFWLLPAGRFPQVVACRIKPPNYTPDFFDNFRKNFILSIVISISKNQFSAALRHIFIAPPLRHRIPFIRVYSSPANTALPAVCKYSHGFRLMDADPKLQKVSRIYLNR
jgi:hypothetical protein